MPNKEKLGNRKVVVTGGAGFIGSNLIEELLRIDANVICLDNLCTGKMENITPFQSNKNFTFVNGDIRDIEVCKKVCVGREIVFHQAALGSVPRSVEDPIPTHETNSTGFINMIQAATKAGVKRFVYASSSSVYGDHKELPKREENIGTHLSPYAVSKYSNELYAKVFGALYGLETIGLRYFNVFGKNQDPEGAYAAVIPKFVKAILLGNTIEIHGDGLQSRDFTFIENVVNANLCAGTTDNSEAFNQVFNVAFGGKLELIALLQMIQDKIKTIRPEITPVEVTHINTRKGDIKHSFADITKAQTLLGYEPSCSVEDGLDKAINWYCNSLVGV